MGDSLQRRALSAAMLISIGAVVAPFLAGVLAVQIKADLQITDPVFGAALTAFYAVEGAGALIAGRYVDRFGWRRSIRAAAAVGLVTMTAIAAFASTAALFVVLLALAGIAQAIAGPASNLTIARAMPAHRHGVIIGALRSAIPLATIFAGVSVPLLALRAGWRTTFVVAAVFPVLAALAVPRTTERSAHAVPRAGGPRRRVATAPFLLVVGGAGFATIANIALSAFLVSTGVARGISEGRMGLYVAIGSSVGLVMRLAAGWVADRRTVDGFKASAVLLCIGAVGFAALATGSTALVLPGAILGYGAGWGWSGLYHLGVVRNNPDATASASGISLMGLAGGAAIGPLAFGSLAAAVGYSRAWGVATVVMALGAALITFGATRLQAANARPDEPAPQTIPSALAGEATPPVRLSGTETTQQM